MTIRPTIIGVLAAGCALGLTVPQRALAIDDAEFNALKELVNKQGQRLDQLEQVHQQDQKALEQDRKTHDQDQQQIQSLKQQLDLTQKTATDAQTKAEAASQVQPIHPVPEGRDATHNFTMVGDAEVQFGKTDGSHSAFALADFAPIFLFRARDNILFEAGFDVALQNGTTGTHDAGSGTSVDLSFATIDYMMNDYVTFVAGDMLLPLGTYSERAAGWLNKIPDDPMARDFLPGSGIGAQLRGAIPVGSSGQSIAYTVFGANGPSSMDGSGNHDQLDLGGNVGIKSDGTSGNLHGSPSGGGRVGLFYPFKPHYDFELGLSGQAGTWDDADHRLWSAGVVDAAVHIGPNIELKGEYIYTWQQTDDVGTIHPRGWWVQGAYKLAGLNLELPMINNVELVGRYDASRDGFSVKSDRYTVGYVYYLTNTLLFEGDYEWLESTDPGTDHNRFVFQVSYGF
ncbi:MAG TPA: hypothetical protein VFE51_26590 [Verrucomicrobiae bacterium]|nr:hypothetical protein [Verrucomicrobiae bacterium]